MLGFAENNTGLVEVSFIISKVLASTMNSGRLIVDTRLQCAAKKYPLKLFAIF